MRRSIQAALLASLVLVCCLGQRSLLYPGIMEARNFISAREVIESGHWLIPTLNGEPRIAKPPLPTWISTLPMLYTGTDDDLDANRIPSGLAAALMALFVFGLGRCFTGKTEGGVAAVLIFVSSYIVLFMARKNTWDIYAHAFMAGGVLFLWRGLRAESRATGRFLAAALCMALSFLSKGPVAFYALLLPFLIGYLVAHGREDFARHKGPLIGCAVLTLVLAAVWPLLVYLSLPQDAHAVAAKEAAAWADRHTRPFWYYLPQLALVGTLWLPHLLAGLCAPRLRRDMAWRREFLLAMVWFVATIVLLSVIPEKKERYVFPAALPAALVAGLLHVHLVEAGGKAARVLGALLAALTALLGVAGACAVVYLSHFTLASFVPAILLLGLAAAALRWGRSRWAPHLVAATVAAVILVVAPQVEGRIPPRRFHVFRAVREMPQLAGVPMYSDSDLGPERVWALGRKVPQIERSELARFAARGPAGFLTRTPLTDGEGAEARFVREFDEGRRVFYLYLMAP